MILNVATDNDTLKDTDPSGFSIQIDKETPLSLSCGDVTSILAAFCVQTVQSIIVDLKEKSDGEDPQP